MVYILLGNGVEEVEAIAPCDILRRGGVEVCFAGIDGLEIVGGHGIAIKADVTAEDMDLCGMEMIVLPGGLGGVRSIQGSKAAMDAVRYAYDKGKYVAAICAAPTILAELGITDQRSATAYPGMEAEMGSAVMLSSNTVSDGTVLTGRGPGAAMDFGFMLLKALKGEDVEAHVRRDMVYIY